MNTYYLDDYNKKYRYVTGFYFSKGERGEYAGDTIDELFSQIAYSQAIQEWIKETLMYGYFWEWRVPVLMYSKEYTIDNCLYFYWYIKDEQGNLITEEPKCDLTIL